MPFSDSDVYKLLEAAAWDSCTGSSAEIERFVELATTVVARAQRTDGYINSWFQGQHPELVWKDLRWGHELYCAGHLLQAAVATERAGNLTGLLDVAGHLVDHLVETFSLDDGDGRLVGVCGHPEVEAALVEYYRLSGDPRALSLAKRQVDLRGRPDVALPTAGLFNAGGFPLSYFLHHSPVRRRTVATGHAVRELYLQAGVVDVAMETADEELLSASEKIWEDLFAKKTYVTGAHGSRHRDESIGDSYELPSDRAYAETCAAIASFQWNWRLLLATGRARYAEAMERVFWNTIAGAISGEGTEFFYSNTLHLRTDHDSSDEDSPRQRLSWYQCACCPPNVARLMASVHAYVVTRSSSGLQVQMLFSGRVSTEVPGGSADIALHSHHPWDATTNVEVQHCTSGERWDLSLRIPDWSAKERARVMLNGRPAEVSWDGPYVKISRQWRAGDRLQLTTTMPVRVVRPHWRADAIRDCIAVERGPLVYCLEADDLADVVAVEDIVIHSEGPFEPTESAPAGLEGRVKRTVQASGYHIVGTDVPLYGSADAPGPLSAEPISLTLVPYFARGNRPRGAMRVWIPRSKVPGSAQEHETAQGGGLKSTSSGTR